MAKLLWQPSKERIERANLTRFMRFVTEKEGKTFAGYDELYQWSTTEIERFWAAVWEFCGVVASSPHSQVVDDPTKMPGAKWFEGAKLNFAENLLRHRDGHTALIFQGEDLEPRTMSYAQLYDETARLATSLREAGVKAGDRVAGYTPNMLETVVAMLAASSIGAIWSSCSPDFGIKGVLDRFGQIEPKILFAANGYYYNGKAHDSLDRVRQITTEIPSIEKVVIIPLTEEHPDLSRLSKGVGYNEFLSKTPAKPIEFAQLPFDHPLYIMYSSGTTGVPKCIVHGAGGTLLQHLKEHVLHTNITRNDVLFYFTTCGWMMWNWLVSGLASGATMVLYDGSPFYPDPKAMWRMAQDLGITVFGTSARYLAAVEKAGVKPKKEFDLEFLHAVLSTGSPLSVESFEFVYREVKQDLCLSSISGGTDIIGCFALGNPIGAVYAGELQCRGLGMAVRAYNAEGKEVMNEKGELVCLRPFPSMPIYFWNDPKNEKYRAAYFDAFPGVWHHGDYIEITSTGGVIIHGRSDATLNPAGVRIGTAEIYRQVETVDEILDSIVVGQDWEGDTRIVLFVKLREGVQFSDELAAKVKKAIRENTSPRHVPSKIVAVPDIPYTISGKKVEMAVRNMIHGQPVLNKDALGNPESLEYFRDIDSLKI